MNTKKESINLLPKKIEIVKVPPIKIQGIKTKLTSFICESIQWDGKGVYYEPFMGSGVIGFNIEPQRAVFSDNNPYIIEFYKSIQNGDINHKIVADYLRAEGEKLAKTPAGKESYYYEVRNRFNNSHLPLDFLFLQRSNFNGMIRFNSKGEYNVPFCRKPNRFSKSLITKISNQVKWVEEIMKGKEWEFKCISFEDSFKMMKEGDFVYLDPPYVNRHADYYNTWDEDCANKLVELTHQTKAGFAYSMWYENKYRRNEHIDLWEKGELITKDHFYYIGAKESNRNKMVEALIVSTENLSDYAIDKRKNTGEN